MCLHGSVALVYISGYGLLSLPENNMYRTWTGGQGFYACSASTGVQSTGWFADWSGCNIVFVFVSLQYMTGHPAYTHLAYQQQGTPIMQTMAVEVSILIGVLTN